jgi:hypothetical protein
MLYELGDPEDPKKNIMEYKENFNLSDKYN